jgi:hypothetical protein
MQIKSGRRRFWRRRKGWKERQLWRDELVERTRGWWRQGVVVYVQRGQGILRELHESQACNVNDNKKYTINF